MVWFHSSSGLVWFFIMKKPHWLFGFKNVLNRTKPNREHPYWKLYRELPRGGLRHWSGEGRGIDLQNAIFRVLRLGNGVLMSGIDTTTLNSVERCPRHLIMDLNPIRPVLTRYLLMWLGERTRSTIGEPYSGFKF